MGKASRQLALYKRTDEIVVGVLLLTAKDPL
jgi:hypothetical protein